MRNIPGVTGRSRRTAKAWLACRAAIAFVLGLTACTAHHPNSTTTSASAHRVPTSASSGSAQARVSRLQSALPPGFVAQATTTAPAAVNLPVAPANNVSVPAMRPAPFPAESALRPILAAVLYEPHPVTVHALLVDKQELRPGDRITVAAAELAPAPTHAALFILSGPGHRSEHLVAVANDVASGVITLPTHLPSGTWVIAAEDTSQLRADGPVKTRGTVLVDIGVFTVR